MGYNCKTVLDSISPAGARLTTMEITFPRIVLAEFNTHRRFSRNAASSRAIPVEKMIQKVKDDPFFPVYWGKNQKGMQADEELDEEKIRYAKGTWRHAFYKSIEAAEELANLGVHKQIVNRLLEPFMWVTVIVSSTSYSNFFALRCHPAAQPEIRTIAELMKDVLEGSKPSYRGVHLPYVQGYEKESDLRAPDNHRELNEWKMVSAARCARVSYLTQDGKKDPDRDIELARRLLDPCGNGDFDQPQHLSPFEHVATAFSDQFMPSGNFQGWEQFRKEFAREER